MAKAASRRPSVSKLREARETHLRKIMALPHVTGTAIGEKLTDGAPTGERGLVVFVDRKLPKTQLDGALVPKRVRLGNMSVLTDIVELPGLAPQFGPAPYYCSDGFAPGIVSSISRSFGEIVAVTCAHCIKGPDLDPFSSDPMKIWHPASKRYIDVGVSDYAVYGRGRGVPGDFGFLDAGMFTVEDIAIRAQANAAPALSVWDNVRTNTRVWMETGHGIVHGMVHAIEAVFPNAFADVSIRLTEGGTFKGDSGGLWRTESGLAVAIHTMGSDLGPNAPSDLSVGMFAHRVRELLGVEFLDL